jgi:hypothetical protein
VTMALFVLGIRRRGAPPRATQPEPAQAAPVSH